MLYVLIGRQSEKQSLNVGSENRLGAGMGLWERIPNKCQQKRRDAVSQMTSPPQSGPFGEGLGSAQGLEPPKGNAVRLNLSPPRA